MSAINKLTIFTSRIYYDWNKKIELSKQIFMFSYKYSKDTEMFSFCHSKWKGGGESSETRHRSPL